PADARDGHAGANHPGMLHPHRARHPPLPGHQAPGRRTESPSRNHSPRKRSRQDLPGYRQRSLCESPGYPAAHQVARAVRVARRNRRCLQGHGHGHLRDRHQGDVSMPHFFENINFRFDMYGHLSAAVWLLVALALSFDFLNGLHDAANSVATVVSTRVLSPQMAIVWAAFFNFVSFIFFSHAVASTINKDIINPEIVSMAVIFAALMGAIVWNVLTWLL